jgi:uncharacterized protein
MTAIDGDSVAGDTWYKKGLRFTCTQCGDCCTGAPGYVWISEDETTALAKRLGVDEAAFRRRYTRMVKGRGRTLIERPDEKRGNACIFWQNGVGCSVYTDRPKQCRTWPFWRPLVEFQSGWDAAANTCPGMNHGKRHSADTIARVAADDGLA